MKRNIKIAFCISACIFMVLIIIKLLIPSSGIKVDTASSKSVFLQIEKCNKMKAAYVRVNYSDMKILESILNGYDSKDTPSCPFHGVKIIFNKDKKVILYPAGDGCPLICIKNNNNNYYLHLTNNENYKLKHILKKYGVIYPFGI